MAGIYVSVLIACWGLDPGSKKAPEEGEGPSNVPVMSTGEWCSMIMMMMMTMTMAMTIAIAMTCYDLPFFAK